ncbi:MAG: 1-acyl-sn-glycerol-3-phosphate acyltransferase [Pseudomonadota bacterium]|nr:1-acyl-sn-glycerol-3-phosphate acyltransferase [Pseudomonadota bacterium]
METSLQTVRPAAVTSGPGLFLRSLAFNIAFFSLTTVCCALLILTLPLPRRCVIWGIETYERMLDWLERKIIRLDYTVSGLEHIPQGPFLLAAKHQSAWETMKLHLLLRDPAVVLKRELMLIPLWGWLAARAGMISVHRNKRGRTIPSLIRGAKKVAAEGRPIVIFPQGTRVAPGDHRPYKIGIGILYQELGLPVVPMALNSGLFWPRHSFIKQPGTVTVQFLPPMPPGLTAEELVKKLQDTLETASDRLLS